MSGHWLLRIRRRRARQAEPKADDLRAVALDENGRLRPGYYYAAGGVIKKAKG